MQIPKELFLWGITQSGLVMAKLGGGFSIPWVCIFTPTYILTIYYIIILTIAGLIMNRMK